MSIVTFKNYYCKKGLYKYFQVLGILFWCDYFFSMKGGYRECLCFVCMLFWHDYFLVWMGVIGIFGGVGKNFRVCRYALNLFESYRWKSVPEPSIYNYCSSQNNNNWSIIDQSYNWNVLLFKEAYHIKEKNLQFWIMVLKRVYGYATPLIVF